ncbi:hypothetical protein NDU88_011824 [Pleurodeles waltl]|uniref:RING-type domain-containing protein n=1 Tax=Pleurodeles waltl TaxID=8319 RepID=A0AAV7QZQ5_PLEWA|nr:hypothetical protein NDU88_011824 [Pleurodeles waltl]
MDVQESEDPDLECAICFSQFNNIFRAPKMLQCRHTFCLECLARMNVKSSLPETIQCPMCRNKTSLPAAGLTKLDNNPSVLSCFPESMRRMYSIRFSRRKGQLCVKHLPRSTSNAIMPQLCVRTISQSLDVRHPPSSSEYEDLPSIWGFQNQRCCYTILAMVGVIAAALLISSILLFVAPHLGSSYAAYQNLSGGAVTPRSLEDEKAGWNQSH